MTNPNTKKGSDRFALRMGQICFLGLGGFALWAGLVPLEEGVSASGTVVVENNRQLIQHLEGGIIQDIAIKEGSQVAAGDTLLVLQETASLASRDQIIQEIAALSASALRLSALRDQRQDLNFTSLTGLTVGEDELNAIKSREYDVFVQQRSALAADIAVLSSQQQSARTNAQLKANEIDITRRSLASTQEELTLFENLFEQQLARRDQVIALERRVSDFEGTIARLESEKAVAEAEARSLSTQIAQVQAQFREAISTELRDTTARLQAAEESLSAAQDVLNRAIIKAPVGGEVLNLSSNTKGGVVAPGDTILEIVPSGDSIVASVQIKPTDRAQVFEGLNVRTQVSAYRSWKSPSLEGTIQDVSADLKRDPVSGAAFYEARVQIELPSDGSASALEITPGMPVDVFIFSGKSRTTLDYLMEPIAASVFKGLREG
ncbi:MAG: HlyD family type I secretion periplasmic adaptor subunit [Pseudomonadota bacterium]